VTRFRPSLTETVPLLGPFLIVTVTGLDAQSLVQNVALAICDSTSELTVRETSLGAAAVSACTAEIAVPTRKLIAMAANMRTGVLLILQKTNVPRATSEPKR